VSQTPDQPPNPRRVAAGRANRAKRGPLTQEGRERLRTAALRNKPWLRSTGPKSPEGRAQSAINGKQGQVGARSVREVRADLKAVRALIRAMAETCSMFHRLDADAAG
jgi:hypothetical protein